MKCAKMVLIYFLCLQCAPMSCICLDFPFAQISVNIVCIDEVSPRHVCEYVKPSLNGLKMLYYNGCICQVSLQCVLMLCGCSEYLYVQISVHTVCIYDFFFQYVLMFCVPPVSAGLVSTLWVFSLQYARMLRVCTEPLSVQISFYIMCIYEVFLQCVLMLYVCSDSPSEQTSVHTVCIHEVYF